MAEKLMTLTQCRNELKRRKFVCGGIVNVNGHWREYWKRSDGKPDVFADHSATITKIGRLYMISDFLNRSGVK